MLAADTRRARIGPAVTYAFSAEAHHPSWLAKRAVAVDHVSGGRLDLRLAVGAADAATAAAWQRHGIEYPQGGERVRRREEAIVLDASAVVSAAVDVEGAAFRLKGARLVRHPFSATRSARVDRRHAAAGPGARRTRGRWLGVLLRHAGGAGRCGRALDALLEHA